MLLFIDNNTEKGFNKKGLTVLCEFELNGGKVLKQTCGMTYCIAVLSNIGYLGGSFQNEYFEVKKCIVKTFTVNGQLQLNRNFI